jgi:DNA-binding LytR/AlgR family response regulator
MRKIKCIIVDDEPVARKIIREFTEQVDYLELCGEFENAIKAGAFLSHQKADLVFLDIEMPKLSGLEWLKNITSKPMVILTTAFPEYALEGYELSIIDYLLKPISFSRFLKAVEKAKEYAEMKNAAIVQPSPEWLFVRSEKRIEKIEMIAILYIESVGNYVNIITFEKNILCYLTLKGIESQLPPSLFIKIHQSYLINLSKVEAIDGNQVKINNKLLPISRGYKEMFMKIIEDRMLKR